MNHYYLKMGHSKETAAFLKNAASNALVKDLHVAYNCNHVDPLLVLFEWYSYSYPYVAIWVQSDNGKCVEEQVLKNGGKPIQCM